MTRETSETGVNRCGLKAERLKCSELRIPTFSLRTVWLGSARPAFGFGSRRGGERIVGPGVFGIAAAEFLFYFEVGRLPEAGEVLRDLNWPARW